MFCVDFMKWVTENGVQHSGIDVRSCLDEEGKGLYATRNFRENETLICIPRKLIITAGLIADMPAYRDIFKRYHLKPFEALVYFFLLEKQENSEWAPYLRVLPKTFSTPAILYPYLQPEDFPYDLRNLWYEQKNELEAMYRKFAIMTSGIASWSRFLWAWHIVSTRCIYFKNKFHPLIGDDQNGDLAVIPFIDMLNHSNDYQCQAVWDGRLDLYKIVTCRPVYEGDQIFICYGSHTNGSLWIQYGFNLRDNVCNKVEIFLEDFMRLASIAGIRFTDDHRKEVLRAKLPCSVYASDTKPNFGIKACLALLTMDCLRLEYWAKVIYEEAESVNDEDILKILRLLRDEMISDSSKVSSETRWLWKEQIALLDSLLGTE